MPLQIEDNDTEGKITVNGGVFVLDNGRYYEEKDKAQITFTATETINNGKAIISGAFGKTIIIENTQYSPTNDGQHIELREWKAQPFWRSLSATC